MFFFGPKEENLIVKLNITNALNMTEVLNAYKKKRRTVYVEEN